MCGEVKEEVGFDERFGTLVQEGDVLVQESEEVTTRRRLAIIWWRRSSGN